jgi:hypothetical protein
VAHQIKYLNPSIYAQSPPNQKQELS